MATEKLFEYQPMVDPYWLFVQHATLEVYQTPEPILAIYSLGVAPFFSGFLSDLLDTIGLPAKHILLHYSLLHNQPNFYQQLASQVDHEHFCFLSADPYYYDDTHLEHGQTGGWLEIA